LLKPQTRINICKNLRFNFDAVTFSITTKSMSTLSISTTLSIAKLSMILHTIA